MELSEAIESLHLKDYKQALALFKDAAESQNSDACDLIVQMYLMELEDSLTADDYLKYSIKGYEYHSKDGCFNLGTIYRNGILGTPDLNKAYEFFLEGANEQADPRCQYFLGEMLKNGEVGKINVDQAVKYYGLAAAQGYYPAQFMLAKIFENVVDRFQTTLEFYENAVKNDHVDAMLRLAIIYEKGIRVAKDLAKSFDYYKLAADHGSAEAKLKIAKITIEPQNFSNLVKTDFKQAEELLKTLTQDPKISTQIKRDALYYLGQLYEQANDQAKLAVAYECFYQSADLGSLPSMYKYACYLMDGTGCEKDLKESFILFHIVRFIASSNIDPKIKSLDLISPDQLVELSERHLVDLSELISQEEQQDAFEKVDQRLGKIFSVQ